MSWKHNKLEKFELLLDPNYICTIYAESRFFFFFVEVEDGGKNPPLAPTDTTKSYISLSASLAIIKCTLLLCVCSAYSSAFGFEFEDSYIFCVHPLPPTP